MVTKLKEVDCVIVGMGLTGGMLAKELTMAGVSVVGLAIVTRGDWRLGVRWIAAALVLAAMARLVLPSPQAGMLAVRRRTVDVVILVGVGAALWFLSSSIPNQPLL